MGTTPHAGAASAGPNAKKQPPLLALEANKSISKDQTPRSAKRTPGKGKKKAKSASVAKYALRSSSSSVRTLRPRSSEGKKENPVPVAPTGTSVEKGRRKGKKKKREGTGADDEFARMRLRVVYYFRRMNYEQSLVEAYAAEGWRGQSLEKIRPEKELERAKSEITRCKLKIRDLFQQLDCLLLEGKLEESLFDSNGQIDSEDIFCAKCGSKDLSAGNDIILCDGVCNRGFHQKCLSPPLLNEDIPSGDEGWLCPGCDCKVECMDFVNEFQGTDLSIDDDWEKIFPEAAASVDKKNLLDNLGLPSDDSEDEDFAPDDLNVVDGQGSALSSSTSSSSEDSDFTAEDLDLPNNGYPNGDLGLPSDDSEDDDYNPDDADTNKRHHGNGTGSDVGISSSDESDFSSDSEGSGAVHMHDDTMSKSSRSKSFSPDRGGNHNSELPSLSDELLSLKEPDAVEDTVSSLGKRRPKIMDSSRPNDVDSDIDGEMRTGDVFKKLRHEVIGKVSSREKQTSAKSSTRRTRKKSQPNVVDTVNGRDNNLSTPSVNKRSDPMRLDNEMSQIAIPSPSADVSVHPLGSTSTGGSRARTFGKDVYEKLLELFKEEQYPTAEVKRNLADQLGITYKQVDRWFINKRHNFRATASDSRIHSGNSSPKDTPKHVRNVKPARTIGVAGRTPTSKLQKKVGPQTSPMVGVRTVKDVSVSPLSTVQKSKGTTTEREKLVLRELRKLKKKG